MDFTMHDATVRQSKERCATSGPMESSKFVHAQCAYTKNPGGFRQDGAKLLRKVDLREAKLNTLRGGDLTICGVKFLRARVVHDGRPPADNVALGDQMITTDGVRNPEDTVLRTNRCNAALVQDHKRDCDVSSGMRCVEHSKAVGKHIP